MVRAFQVGKPRPWACARSKTILKRSWKRSLKKRSIARHQAVRTAACMRMGQVVHFKADTKIKPSLIHKALNSFLDRDLSVVKVPGSSAGFSRAKRCNKQNISIHHIKPPLSHRHYGGTGLIFILISWTCQPCARRRRN